MDFVLFCHKRLVLFGDILEMFRVVRDVDRMVFQDGFPYPIGVVLENFFALLRVLNPPCCLCVGI